MIDFKPAETFARQLDSRDPLAGYRRRFNMPRRPDGRPAVYLCGNSLGLQPAAARELVTQELDAWAELAVDAHFQGRSPWYGYHEQFRDSAALLVGARPGEVVLMNSLTVNLHLMMVSFYRPTPQRHKILMAMPSFPSDLYAVKSQLRHHGYDPQDALLTVQPPAGRETLEPGAIQDMLARHGAETALLLLEGVNFFTGQLHDLHSIAAAAQHHGCFIGLDLAHAAGNVPLNLHDWGVDFAVWCSYKYLNSGPGAVAGCFVHERHGCDAAVPRLAGWWGNDPERRFLMHLLPEFEPQTGAAGWQLSNPPIFSFAPLAASLELFAEAGMAALRQKSELLTAYLEYLLDGLPAGRAEIITPRDPQARGCQLSIVIHERPRDYRDALHKAGVVCDYREPNVIRLAPVPLYNTFHDVWRVARALGG